MVAVVREQRGAGAKGGRRSLVVGSRPRSPTPTKAPPRGYAEIKRDFTGRVATICAASGARCMSGPVALEFDWHEADRHRDPDNIAAASKFIIDGMVNAHVLAGDNHRSVTRLVHRFVYPGDEGYDRRGVGVVVWLLYGAVRVDALWFGVRFPDLAELIVAARQDGILTERVRSRDRWR